MCKAIAIVNQKGGVGKTTTMENLGAGLAREGKRVCMIDCDPQGSLTICLGDRTPDALERTLTGLLKEIRGEEDADIDAYIKHHPEGFDYIPANIELSDYEVSITSEMNRELILSDVVNKIRDRYEYILMDCMPSLGLITVNVLAAADTVIIPVGASYLSERGLNQLLKTINKVKKNLNRSLQIDGLLITMIDQRNSMPKLLSGAIEENYGKFINIYDAKIPLVTKCAEASMSGGSIYTYAPKTKSADAYFNLVQEVLKHE